MEFDQVLSTAVVQQKPRGGLTALGRLKPGRQTPLNKRVRSLADMSQRHLSESPIDFKRQRTTAAADLDYLFYICSVLDQSHPTKFNALSIFNSFQEKVQHAQRVQKQPPKNIYIFVAIILSSKFFESKPQRLGLRHVCKLLSSDKYDISISDMMEAEWHCLTVLNFRVDWRQSAPYFWAWEFCEMHHPTATTVICHNLDILLSLFLLKYNNTNPSYYFSLDEMMLCNAALLAKIKPLNTELSQQYGIGADDLANHARQILLDLIENFDK